MRRSQATSKPFTPRHWPNDITYLRSPVYHHSVQLVHLQILQGIRPSQPASPCHAVVIRKISEKDHPAFGQHGLFAIRKILPKRHIIDYMGEVHSDDRPNSDYDLSLFRSQDGGDIGIDANGMGNEARFINDYRGIMPKPNARFQEMRCASGELRMCVWSENQTINKGDEICVSYGKSWWRARIFAE